MTQDLSDLKLTKAQRAMLERLSAGTYIHAMYGLRASAFFAGSGLETASLRTAHALEVRGLLERRGAHGQYELHITPAGRAALKALGGSDEQAE